MQDVRFVDIEDEAVMAVITALKRQAINMQLPFKEHSELDNALLDCVEFEYVNGMEWGFHCKEESRNVAYSVRTQLRCQQLA